MSHSQPLQAILDVGREALRRFLVGEDDHTTMLAKIVGAATESVPGCDMASITLMRDGRPSTPVCTDRAALTLDETQYDLGDGPCLACIRHQGVERLVIESDERWPAFNQAAAKLGVVGVLSVPLVDDDTALGGLNLYSKTTA
ncbi:MAG TPA: GAF domain-containing protein, partial [Acidimicrobiales bacterium]|nr:GAF domain-containing protein [Acidimicrobiales bacterium]